MARDRLDGAMASPITSADDQQPLVYLADGARMILPDQTNLLHADFARRGGDLLVGGGDRPALVILDYFAADKTPDLVTEGGAVLAGQVIAKLAGPDLEKAGQGTERPDQNPIGHVEHAEGEVIITRADGSQVVATKGTPIYQDDVIVTDGAGAVGLRFVDGMTLSLGSDARMVLDEFVYNPEAGEGGGIIEIIQGAFSFISGEAAHMGLDSMVIDTPTMTIGIRGTKVVANAAAEGETTEVVLLPEDDGTIGKIMISTDAGQELLEEPFVSTTVTSRSLPPASQSFVTPDWVYSHFSEPLAALPTPAVEYRTPNLDIEVPAPNASTRFDDTGGLHLRDTARFDHQSTTDAARSEEQRPSDAKTLIDNDGPALSTVAELPISDAPTLLDIGFSPSLSQPAPEAPNNEAPTVATPIADTGSAEDAIFSYDVSASFADPDVASGDALTFSAEQSDGTALPAWLSINPTTGVLSGTPLNASVGSLTLTITATDSAGASAASDFQLTVSNTNDTPIIVTPITDANTAEDAVFSYDVSASFADDDSIHGDTLTFGATLSGGAPLPAWLAFDPATGVLSGTPVNADVGALTIDVTATDAAGASTTGSFQLSVNNSNDVPVVVTPIADTGAAEDAAFNYDVSASFGDDDSIHGDSLTFSATQSNGSPLPAWLTIDPATGVLSGTPVNADVAGLTLTVVAVDSAGAGTSASFQLTVTNVNDAPVVVTPIVDASPLENALFNYDVAASFADDDALHGDTLIFSAEQSGGTPLPSWLSIDPATDVLSGTPDATQVGVPYTIAVTATDGSGATATSTFQLSVDNVNDAPALNVVPSPSLTAVSANATDPAGDTIANIIVDGSIIDIDGGAVEALALTGVDGSNGTWEFSINAGTSWTAVGAVSDNAALLLDPSAKLRFVPDPGYGGSATFTFRAWDQTTGSNGQTGVDASTHGGTTAFSLLTDTGSVSVQGTAPDLSSGTEFQVNTTTADRQELPSVAALADGGFVITWQSHDQDGDHFGIYGQRYDSTGSATGSEFQVNTTTAKEQQSPAAASIGDGGFVVTWQSKDQDGDNWGIYGQRYDSTGSATGSEFQINTTTTDEQKEPSVAALDDGGFVVTWQSKGQDGDNWGVFGQRYDSAGNPVEFEFQVNQETSKEQQDPKVSALADGGFFVTWQSKDQDGDNWGVYGRRFNADGDPLGGEFQINTTSTGEQKSVVTAALGDGGLAVTWQSKDQDGDNWGVYGHRYDSETASVTVNPPQGEAASMLDFGGTNSFVDIGDPGSSSDDLDPGRGDVTVEAWFYYDGPNGTKSIVSKGNSGALDAGFNIYLDGNQLVVRASTDGGLDAAAMKVTMTGAPGWHHVAMVLDQESGTAASSIKGYLDGSDAGWSTGHGIVFTSTVTTSASRQIETDDRFLIGAVDDNGTERDFFGAEIADVRVWNTARTQAEIQADLGRTLNGDEPNLLANWQLDDGIGPTASDAVGGYDGTLSGSPSWQDALSLTTAQNTALAGRLSASDLESDTLAYSVAANAANGTASIDADKGTWTYDPAAGFSGSDSFSYQISDGNGGSDTVTIAVTVTP